MYPEIFSFLGSMDSLYMLEDFDELIDVYGRRAFIQYLFQKERIEKLMRYPRNMKLNLSEIDQLIRIMQER
jgi:hypothetical protein